MKVTQLVVQLQMQLEDGSTVVFATPTLVGQDLEESKARDTVLALGLTPQQIQEKGQSNISLPGDEIMIGRQPGPRRGPRLFGG